MKLNPGMLLRFITFPLTDRVRKGEGGLVIFNLLHAAFAFPGQWERVAAETCIAITVLTALYGFNDYIDRHRDLHNTKKNRGFTMDVASSPRLFLSLNIALSTFTVLLCLAISGYPKTLALICLYMVNCGYSLRLKSLPIFDLLTVIAWGGLFVSISGHPDPYLALSAGLMTALAHVYQMITDHSTDSFQGVGTTVVRMPGITVSLIAILSLALGVVTLNAGMGLWSILTVIPPAMALLRIPNALSWHLSRAIFAILWIALLSFAYAT